MGRREDVLDAAIDLLGEQGARAVTHRAVDAAAGLPPGSTSNLFRSRDALFDGIVERFAARDRAAWEEIVARAAPGSPDEAAAAFAELAHVAVGPNRTLSLARYGVLLEAARRPELRDQVAATGAEVSAYVQAWMAKAGLGPDGHVLMNYWTGLVLHQLAMPDPGFDPTARLRALLIREAP